MGGSRLPNSHTFATLNVRSFQILTELSTNFQIWSIIQWGIMEIHNVSNENLDQSDVDLPCDAKFKPGGIHVSWDQAKQVSKFVCA